MTFQPANRWVRRLYQEQWNNKDRGTSSYPIRTISYSLNSMRLEKEDLEAFHKVQEATGGPTETQFLDLCRENYRDFEPRSRERAVIPEPDIRRNAAILWKALWNHELDIEREITRKVEEILHKDWYGYDPNLKEELKSVIRPRKAPE